MKFKEYIPFTQARRDRLLAEIYGKEASGYDGLVEIEWEDGTKSLRGIEFDEDNSALVDDQDNRWFARGLGSEAKDFMGVPIYNVYAGNAGVVSTEACLIADAERFGDRVYDVGAGDELPDDLIAEGLYDPNQGKGPADAWDVTRVDRELVEAARRLAEEDGDLEEVSAGAEDGGGLLDRVAPDGGVAAAPGESVDARTPPSSVPDPEEVPEDAAVYDLRPPEGYDGIAFSVRDPHYFDPFPVTRADAKGAVEWAQQAIDTSDTWMNGFIVGVLVVLAVWVLFTVIPWLLGQIGGGGGGAGPGSSVTGLLLLLGGPSFRSLVRRVRGGEG